MLEQKEVVFGGKTYILHKFPAVAGHDIYNLLENIASPEDRHKLMLRVMSFVGVRPEPGNPTELRLDSVMLIDNHVPDTRTLLDLETAALEYSFDFFAPGEISGCLLSMERVAQERSTEMLTDFLLALLKAAEQPSKNSKRSTR